MTMMEIKAKLNYLGISPRKVRLVADLIRGLKAEDAEFQLRFSTQRAAFSLLKLLNSAIANAKHNFVIEKENLHVSKIAVNTGPILKRWRPRSRGMAAPIKKRTSHVELVLEERGGKQKKSKRIKGVKDKEIVKKEAALEEAPKEVKPEKATEKKPVFKPKRKIEKPRSGGIVQKIFRRKAIG